MITELKKWLADYFETSEEKTESYLRNENVTGFLIIWTIYEQQLFDGFQTYSKIKKFANDKFENCPDEIFTHFNFFYERYQDGRLLKNLVHDDKHEDIKTILRTDKSDVKKVDKLLLVLYVVYRYRNNIFHGNKSVKSWVQYSKEIEKCVNVMTSFLKKS